MAEARTDQDRSNRRALIAVLLLTVPLAIALFLCLPNAGPVFRLFSVPASSMAPTLPLGSYMIASRLSYGYSRHSFDSFALPIADRWPAAGLPQRGDIVVFRLPRDHRTFFVKRVIGVAGDTVQMAKGRLWLNGQMVPRDAAGKTGNPPDNDRQVDAYLERLPDGPSYRIVESQGDTGHFDNTALFTVPAGHLFVLGDNRDNSSDSREQSPRFGVGFVPVDLVLGRVVLTFGGTAP